MKPFKKILFPVDLSDVSPRITPWIIMMAERFEAQVYLLFVARGYEHLSSFQHFSCNQLLSFPVQFKCIRVSKFVPKRTKIIQKQVELIVDHTRSKFGYFNFHSSQKIFVPGLRVYIVFKKSCNGLIIFSNPLQNQNIQIRLFTTHTICDRSKHDYFTVTELLKNITPSLQKHPF